MRTLLCQNCKMFTANEVKYLEPSSWAGPNDAKLCVVVDEPTKKDHRTGKYLAEEAGQFLEEVLQPFVGFDQVFTISAIRCSSTDRKVKAKSNEAKLCQKQFAGPAMDAYLKAQGHGPVLLMGFWPTKMFTEREIKELHGKVIEQDGTKFGIVYSPNYFIAKNARWTKDEYGKWVYPEAGMRKARTEWRAHAMPVLDRLFADKAAHVNYDVAPEFPFTRVNTPEEMVARLQEREGKYCMHDLESRSTDLAKAMGRTALDWFYDPQFIQITSMGFSFFDNYAQTTYRPGSTSLSYDPRKVCIYTGPYSKPFLTDICLAMDKTKHLTFNASYDTGVLLRQTGVPLSIFADVCDMAYVTNQGRKKYNLESLAYEFMPEFATWAGEIKRNGLHDKLSLPKLWHYNAGDCVIQHTLYFMFAKYIMDMGLDLIYWGVLGPVKHIFRDMEARGVMVDNQKWLEIKEGLETEIQATRESFAAIPVVQACAQRTGATYNPQSQPQTKWILDQLYPGVFKGTGKDILKQFVDATGADCPFIKTLLKYRLASKAYNTYIIGYKKRMQGSIVYSAFKVNTTETGRTSSGGSDVVGLGKTNQVNLQNIPRGGGMRKMFRARPKHYLLYGDYSQIEVRVAGAYANSLEIRDACLSGLDFHGSMAARAFGVPYDEIMAEDDRIKHEAKGGTSKRTASKTITFGILYGMGPHAVAAALKLRKADGTLDIDLAQHFIDEYFLRMQTVKDFIDRTHAYAEKHLHVKTVFGRIRRFDMWNGKARRESVNTLVQSAASDIFLMSTVSTCNLLKKEGLYGRLVHPWAEVHDNFTMEVHESVPVDELLPMVNEVMTLGVLKDYPQIANFMGEIPLAVDFGHGEGWK